MDGVVRRGTVAVIPARGGSRRLPRKNIMPFAGRPMLAWTVEAALGAGAFDRVIVSTEDEEIAQVARAAGAEVPFLRRGAFDDQSPISLATLATLTQLRETLAEDYETVVQLMANCPLRTAGDIRAALDAFEASGADFQISCTRYGWLNPWWAFTRSADGAGDWLFPQARTQRSQDLEALFCPTGAIWIARQAALEAAGSFYGPRQRFEPLAWHRAIDIDDAEDFAFAESVRAFHAGRPGSGS